MGHSWRRSQNEQGDRADVARDHGAMGHSWRRSQNDRGPSAGRAGRAFAIVDGTQVTGDARTGLSHPFRSQPKNRRLYWRYASNTEKVRSETRRRQPDT